MSYYESGSKRFIFRLEAGFPFVGSGLSIWSSFVYFGMLACFLPCFLRVIKWRLPSVVWTWRGTCWFEGISEVERKLLVKLVDIFMLVGDEASGYVIKSVGLGSVQILSKLTKPAISL